MISVCTSINIVLVLILELRIFLYQAKEQNIVGGLNSVRSLFGRQRENSATDKDVTFVIISRVKMTLFHIALARTLRQPSGSLCKGGLVIFSSARLQPLHSLPCARA